MSQAYTLQFVHRLNDDGSIDSICRECFATVASARLETTLVEEQQKHRCDPRLLDRYKKLTPYKNFANAPRLA